MTAARAVLSVVPDDEPAGPARHGRLTVHALGDGNYGWACPQCGAWSLSARMVAGEDTPSAALDSARRHLHTHALVRAGRLNAASAQVALDAWPALRRGPWSKRTRAAILRARTQMELAHSAMQADLRAIEATHA